jgi:phosphatidylglycerophosphatase A
MASISPGVSNSTRWSMVGPVDSVAKAIATTLGAGYSPIAPGTCGTVVAIPLVWACAALPNWQFGVLVALLTAIAIWAADRADRAWGTSDSQRIVIDEVVGYGLTMLLVPRDQFTTLAVGFAVFRALDIAKPPPIRWFERWPGGWGVVLDDVAAGALGAGMLALLGHFGVLADLADLL